MRSMFETIGVSVETEENVGALFEGLVQADVDDFYAQAAAIGLSYEDDFKGITELWTADPVVSQSGASGLQAIAVGRLRPGCQSSAWQQCRWDPTVLDALFQLNIALSPREVLIPFAIGQIDFLAPLHYVKSSALYGRASLRHASAGVQVSDLTLMDANGTILVSVQNFEVRRSMVKSTLRRCAWTVTWETLQSDTEAAIVEAMPELAPLSVLVLSQGIADSSRFSDHARACDLLTADAKLLTQGWATCVVIVDTSEAAHESALLAVMHVINLAHEVSFKGTIWVVTEGAQHVGSVNAAPKLAGIWGLVRTARIEMPALRLGCLDTSPGSSSTLCRWQILQDPSVEPEVSIYHEGNISVRRAPRLKEVIPYESFEKSDICFDPERTYLITGGLSGFGLRTAVWMCERGARHLALLSRTGAVRQSDSVGMADWERLQSFSDAEVRAIACNIADAAAVATALQEINSKGMPPLGGVIHAAGVLSDAMLQQQTADKVRAVYAPKVDGAYNLHEATAGYDPPLHFFAVFSSVAGVLGSAGQANYAAANSCIDAFVAWRRSLGLPGCSLAWGPLAEVGMAARHGTAKRVHAQGLDELSIAMAFEALEFGLNAAAPPSTLAVPAKWDRWIARHPSYEPFLRLAAPAPRLFTHTPLERGHKGSCGTPAGPSLQQAHVRKDVVGLIATLIGPAGASQLHDDSVLLECGLDSLGTMELRQTLSRRFDVPLPPNFLDLHRTLGELVASFHHLIPNVTKPDGSAKVPAPSPSSALQPTSAAQLCHIWDASVGPEVALAVATFFGGVAPVRLGPQSSTHPSVQTTIVVIGWAGASPEALAPIVAWHRGQGYHVLQLIPALGGELDTDCCAALDALGQDNAVLAGRCFLHCFSNNSIFFLRRMLSDRPQPFERPRLLPLRGLIIDSAPNACEDLSDVDKSGPIALQAHLAASLGASSASVTQQHSTEQVGLLQAVADAHWQRRRSRVVGAAIGSVVLPGGAPRLCIYGTLDSVVQPSGVKTWIDEERRRGEYVDAVELQSGHVTHHLAHAREYWAAVSRFLSRGLQ